MKGGQRSQRSQLSRVAEVNRYVVGMPGATGYKETIQQHSRVTIAVAVNVAIELLPRVNLSLKGECAIPLLYLLTSQHPRFLVLALGECAMPLLYLSTSPHRPFYVLALGERGAAGLVEEWAIILMTHELHSHIAVLTWDW